ncbi:Na+/H+ antiporter subunit E [Terrimicrobium sacchariphilum]|jgi:multisubunit Na+/H+ antiporter MnhE subunit|nr:Na+/H+ antiporter subunit E [Terrimicrobium sacchariphilum]
MHLLIALVAMFLSGNTTLGGLALGLVGGFALMALFRSALGCQHYIRRVVAVLAFGFIFLQQVVSSNLRLVGAVLRRDAGSLEGEYISYSVEGLTKLEVLLIAQCISLTPGTIVADKSADGRALILHTFASGSPEEIRNALDEGLKRPILAITR